MAGNVINSSDRTFDSDVLRSPIPVLVEFWSQYCGPCRSIAPVLERMADEYAGKVRIVKVDSTKNQLLTDRYNVQNVPLFLMFNNGQIVGQELGAVPKARLEALFRPLIGSRFQMDTQANRAVDLGNRSNEAGNGQFQGDLGILQRRGR